MSIITVSREMGSGGIPIVHQVAEELNYTLVDGDVIKDAAEDYDLTHDALRQIDEKPPAFVDHLDRKIELNMNRIQLIVLEQALLGDVVIYGRGGQDLLSGVTSAFRVRIIAPFEERVESWAQREWIDPDLARYLVRRSDQQRAGFIKYYFDRNWTNPIEYDMVINTVRVSDKTAVKLITEAIKDPYFIEKDQSCKIKIKDLIIQKKIQIARLDDERIKDIWFNIDVTNCHVTLSGHIHSEKERQAVLEDANSVEEVIEITDKLKLINY